jgi:adenylate cyclase
MSNADRDATMYASMREFERTITFELCPEVLPHQSESLLRELGSFCPLILLKYLKQKLSATVPVTGTWKARASLRASMSIQPVGSHHFRGVCMVADVSGFVDLSNLYCSKGVAGVDELQRLIDDYFVEIIDLVYSFGGDVLYIAGDAIICVFESENCCENAVRCGGNLLQHCFPQMRLHVAFAYGDLTLTLLGGCGGCMSYLVTGAPMQDMFSIIGQAGEDEIIVSATFRNEIVARELVALMDITLTPTESGSFKMCLGEVYEVHQPVFERLNFNIDRSLADASRAFLPSLVSSFIGSYELNRCFTELRHVSTLFMRLDSFTTANLDDPLSLQEYFMILQKTLTETQGYMRQFVADDKGLILVAMWGVPSYSSTNNALKALQFALQARSRCQEIGLSTSIGISTGLIFCGIIGADTRRDYIGLGDHVNFAARLMGAAKGRVLLDRSTFSAVPNAAQSCLKLSDDLLLKGLKDPIT